MFINNLDLNELLKPTSKEEMITTITNDIKEIQSLLEKLGIKGTFI